MLGIKKAPDGSQTYYEVNYDQLKIFNYDCFATYSDDNEMIILLKDEQSGLIKGNQPKKILKSSKSIQVRRK